MAVAVVIAALRRRMVATTDVIDMRADMDENGDGVISAAELRKSMIHVEIRADRMVEILAIEKDLAQVVIKMPNFCMCIICFLVALCEFAPPKSSYNVHRHLDAHYNLGLVKNIKTLEAIYEYMEEFEHHNEEMQATSYQYWCESIYSEHHWDEHYMVPIWKCPSPRLYALGMISDPNVKWSNLNGGGSPGSSSASGSGSSASGSSSSASGSSSHRRLDAIEGRLLGGSGSSGSGSSGSASGIVAVRPVPPCEDDDAQLQEEESDPNATCTSAALDPRYHICDFDLGILLCAKTCGYCAPFTYDHLKRFEKPQVTMLPVMVFQTRFETADCHGFAHTYELQPYNPVITLLPALDGVRRGRVLTCIDRTKHQHSDYALELDCPDDTPASHCHNNKVRITLKHTFHGDVVYPKMLIEPHRDVVAMRQIEWLDLQTEIVTLSTMIYTEGIEIFTSLSVEFKIDEAGNVDGSFTMISYRDMLKGSKDAFIACLIVCAIGAFVGIVLSDWYVLLHRVEGKFFYSAYELFSRLLLLVYPIDLLFEWGFQVPMAEEFDHLLHSFLDLESLEEDVLEERVQKYFDTKTHIYHETTWMKRHRVVAYLVCYVQFLQLIFYCNAHPKMAVLTATVIKALDLICHFMLLFAILYFMLAFMGHWMLGQNIPEFGTFGETIKNQMRMMFGAFIQASRVDELYDAMTVMYWLYAITFMLIVIWVLLNFFLAIVVDAFVDVKGDNQSSVAARGFVSDLFGVVRTCCVSGRRNWPTRQSLLEFFQEVVDYRVDPGSGDGALPKWMEDLEAAEDGGEEEASPAPTCTARNLELNFPDMTEDDVASLLHHYYTKCPGILCKSPGARGADDAAADAVKPKSAREDALADAAGR